MLPFLKRTIAHHGLGDDRAAAHAADTITLYLPTRLADLALLVDPPEDASLPQICDNPRDIQNKRPDQLQ